MKRTWTFGRTIAAGFTVVVLLTITMAVTALVGLTHVVERKDAVIDTDARMVLDVQKLLTIRDARAAANRGYLVSGQPKYLNEQYRDDGLFTQQLNEVRTLSDTVRGRELVEQVATLQGRFVQLDREPVELKQAGASSSMVAVAWEKIDDQRLAYSGAMDTLYDYQQGLVDVRKRAATESARFAVLVILGVLIAIVLAAAGLAWVLTRRLRSRIGSAVGAVQTSSTELQSTANQQAVGAKEQATTMSEISTTTTELLASSRQIAENAQRVTNAADQTSQAGQIGRTTVSTALESMTEIRTQVDTIVDRMVELGDKSQQIGLVVDIVSELAEQTNILAINSTIEAVGAGESGKRFAVVADEIRKLADRVTESTKDIRDLIDGTRTAVNTTVIAIEIGSKAVDAGAAQVEQVASSLAQIVTRTRTTTEAAQEIELSTKQQTMAVEQVNQAIANVVQTVRETEASSTQTLHTASQLRQLSTKLRELVVAGAPV